MSRKLDAAIARGLDYKDVQCFGVLDNKVKIPPTSDCSYVIARHKYDVVPHFSTDGNAMLELDKEMRERGYCFRHIFVVGSNNFEMTYYSKNDNTFTGEADSMPKAVALAAYKALTGKEWQDD